MFAGIVSNTAQAGTQRAEEEEEGEEAKLNANICKDKLQR